MNMLIRTINLFACVVLLTQCQKVELPASDEGAPVFTLQATIDGAPIDIVAGDSGYVMDPSFRVDTTGVPVYTGTFRELECAAGCLPFISVSIRGSAPGSAQPDTDLQIGAYPFLEPAGSTTEISYRIRFSGEHDTSVEDSPVAFSWDFGDGTSSSQQSPEHEYPDDTPRRVALETINAAGCTSSVEKVVAFQPLTVPCEVDFTIQLPQGASPAQAVFNGPFNNYQTWFWPGGDSSMLTNYPIFQLLPQEIREICLTAVNTEGCQAQTCQSVFMGNAFELGYCATDFTYQALVDTTFTPAPAQFGTVWIEYGDETGRIFSSALGVQDTVSGNFFRIFSREPFEPSENGQPTEKLEVSFQCRLYDSDGQFRGILSGTGAIAVALP